MESYLNQLVKLNQATDEINGIFREKGYVKANTSYFEAYDDYLDYKGRTKKDATVKVVNNKGDVVILRPDMTFNILKKIALIYTEPLKLSYDSYVFENTKEGVVEKRQLGIESYGNLSIEADLEVIQVAMKVIKKQDSLLVLGHTKFINGLLSFLDNKTLKDQVKEAIYKKQAQQLEDLLKVVKVERDVKDKIMTLVQVQSTFDDYAKGYMNAQMKAAYQEMVYIKRILKDQVVYDLSLLSKFDYYDGIIFKAYIKDLKEPVLRGGRYDGLSNNFDVTIPAVGFSLNFDLYKEVLC